MSEFRQEFHEYQQRTWAGPIEQAAAEATAVYVELESWLDDDLSCESVHVMTGIHNCQHTVTHHSTIRCKGRSKLICIIAARWNLDAIAEGGCCEQCGRLTSECWSVVPV